jgi:hypothetical protein
VDVFQEWRLDAAETIVPASSFGAFLPVPSPTWCASCLGVCSGLPPDLDGA